MKKILAILLIFFIITISNSQELDGTGFSLGLDVFGKGFELRYFINNEMYVLAKPNIDFNIDGYFGDDLHTNIVFNPDIRFHLEYFKFLELISFNFEIGAYSENNIPEVNITGYLQSGLNCYKALSNSIFVFMNFPLIRFLYQSHNDYLRLTTKPHVIEAGLLWKI